MVHLDFKPQNVLLFKNKKSRKGYHLKLIDFGASEKMDDRVITDKHGELLLFRTMVPQQVCCSVQYYAPEQRIHFYYAAFGQREENVVCVKKFLGKEENENILIITISTFGKLFCSLFIEAKSDMSSII